MARPKADIDWKKVGKLLQAQCSAVGIASMFGISTDTLYLRCKQDLKMDFTAFSAEKKSEGVELLRAKQYETAFGGNVTMQIWLGKQYLGQRDKTETDHNIKNVEAIDINYIVPNETEV
jgi:hypothetical protein